MRWVLIGLIKFYRFVLSPDRGLMAPLWKSLVGPTSGCRFTPSCSEYAIEALRKYGALKGSALAIKRISRCHGGNPGGYDPVP
jgi:hypothetical protein